MKTFINTISHVGKLKCIHYYYLCRSSWYHTFLAIFEFYGHFWLYRVCNPYNPVTTIFDYVDICPSNMMKALCRFKQLIY